MQFKDCIKQVVCKNDIGELRKAYTLRYAGHPSALKEVDEFTRQFILSNAKKVYTAHFERVARKNANVMPKRHVQFVMRAARSGQFSTARFGLGRYGVKA